MKPQKLFEKKKKLQTVILEKGGIPDKVIIL